MKLDAALKPPGGVNYGRRFFLSGYLPTFTAFFFLLVLVWAGARAWKGPARPRMSFQDAWATAAALGPAEVLLLALAVLLVAITLQPLQPSLVRVLEGSWPSWLGAGLARKRQLGLRAALRRTAVFEGVDTSALTEGQIQEAGKAGAELHRRFPFREDLVRATALGNALTAMEDGAGRAYGFDAVVVWPRLYPVLGEKVTSIVDDRRDSLDTAAQTTVVMALTAVVSTVLLCRTGWWLLLALVPVVLAAASYSGAVRAALAYGDAVHVAFDLHRFDLLAALRLDLPGRPSDEPTQNAPWSDFWRQGIPLPASATYTKEER